MIKDEEQAAVSDSLYSATRQKICIYATESEVPTSCLILDHNTGLLCAELLEYH